jgi:hypothetical protein
LVWFGEIERKLAKLSLTTFTYQSSCLQSRDIQLQSFMHLKPVWVGDLGTWPKNQNFDGLGLKMVICSRLGRLKNLSALA